MECGDRVMNGVSVVLERFIVRIRTRWEEVGSDWKRFEEVAVV